MWTLDATYPLIQCMFCSVKKKTKKKSSNAWKELYIFVLYFFKKNFWWQDKSWASSILYQDFTYCKCSKNISFCHCDNLHLIELISLHTCTLDYYRILDTREILVHKHFRPIIMMKKKQVIRSFILTIISFILFFFILYKFSNISLILKWLKM